MSRFFAAALVAVFVAPFAAWADDCVPMDDLAEGTWANYWNTAECAGSLGPSAASECAATLALPSNDQCGLAPSNRTFIWTSGLSLEASDGSGPTRYIRYGQVRRVSDNNFCGNFYVQVSRTSTSPAYCTADPDIECSALANQTHGGAADGRADSWAPEDTICVKTANVGGSSATLGGPGNQNGCAAFKRATQTYKRLGTTNDREWIVQYQFTGMECDAEPEQTETPMQDEGEVCKTGAGGLTWCENPQDTTGKDCGFFNDKYVCLDSLGTDKCFTQADGSRLCASNAPTPPVPDNGTPGVKATPDDVMQVCTGENACQSINYYNSTSASGSSRDPGEGAQSDGSGTVGAGGATIGNGNGTDPEGEEGGSVSGGATCAAEPVCTGDAVQCAQLMQSWRARCPDGITESEALDAIGATDAEKGLEGGPNDGTVTVSEIDGTGFIVGGSCPNAGSFTVMGQNISMANLWQPACDMAVLFAPIVQAMGFLFAALLLVRTNWG